MRWLAAGKKTKEPRELLSCLGKLWVRTEMKFYNLVKKHEPHGMWSCILTMLSARADVEQDTRSVNIAEDKLVLVGQP